MYATTVPRPTLAPLPRQARERPARCPVCGRETFNLNGRCDDHGGDGPGIYETDEQARGPR